MRTVLVASAVFAVGASARSRNRTVRARQVEPMQPEASPRSETGVPAIQATPGASAPFSASANPILRVPVSELHPGDVSFTPNIDNPLAKDPQATTRGMQDFIQFNCVGCHAANGGGGMGPALSEGQFIYGSSSRQFVPQYLSGASQWDARLGRDSTRIDDLGARRLRPEHRSSAERDIWRNDLENAVLPRSRADAVGVPADAESVELHERLQQRPKASG